MENKNSKTGAIIGTIVAVLLCACPGLCILLIGIMTAIGGSDYSSQFVDIMGFGPLPGWFGYVFMCMALFLIAIPIVVGLLTLRDKKPKEVDPPNNEPIDPIPPTS